MKDLDDQRLLAVEQRELDEVLSQSKGYYFLLLGRPIGLNVPVPCCIKVFDHPNFTEVQADNLSLPFADDSIDVVVLVHGLEHANDPTLLLKEAKRVLRHDGRLIILGYNPWRFFARRRWAQEGERGRMISMLRLRYLLTRAELNVLEVRRYGLALKSETQQGGLSHWLKRCLPWYSSGYLLIAGKQTHSLTPLPLHAYKILKLAEKPVVATSYRERPRHEN